MKKTSWLKYLSIMMTLVLTISMMPMQGVLASEDGSGKTVISAFDGPEAPAETSFTQGTKKEDLGLPGEVTAYDEAGNPITLSDVVWKVKAKSDENNSEVKAEKYSESLPAGEYVFLLSLGKEYKLADGVERPKFYITITEPETEAPTEAETAPATETNAVTEPVNETETNAETEPVNETETNAETEPVNETETNAETEPVNETETNTETEPVNETETNTETETNAVTELVNENETETNPATEPVGETETNAATEPVNEEGVVQETETGAETEGNLGEAPMIKLEVPESMEVGKTYQLQYSLSNDELKEAGEGSVSYQAVEGKENVDMPDQSGNFTVVSEGPVTFQVEVTLENGTQLQASATGTAIPESPQAEEPSAVPGNEAPTKPTTQENESEFDWEAHQLSISTLPSTMSVGQTIDLGAAYEVVDGNGQKADYPAEGLSLVYSIQNVEPADTAIASVEGTKVTASGAGKFKLVAQLMKAGGSVLLTKETEVTASNWYDGVHMELTGLPEKYKIGDTVTLNYVLKDAAGNPVNAPEGTVLNPVYAVDNTNVASLSGNTLTIAGAGAFNLTASIEGTTIATAAAVSATVKSNIKEIIGFTLNDIQASINGTSITVSLPCSADLTKAVPKITINGASINGGSVDKISGKAADFSKAVQYVVAAEDGTTVTYTVTATKKEHNYISVKKDATCTENGYSYKECQVCGDVKDKKTIKKLGHKWGEWKTTKEPTTTSKGQQTRTCSRCKEKETREIQRLNIVAQASQNVIWGFANPAKYPVNSTITFEAIGDGMDNESPIKGDTRFVPASTWNLVNDYQWGNNGYTATFKITKAGTYTLTVNFQEQKYDGSQWVNTGTVSSLQQKFVIEGNGSYTDKNGNGTGNTKNPDQVVNGTVPVKTGDASPIIPLLIVLVIAAIALIGAVVYRRKRGGK